MPRKTFAAVALLALSAGAHAEWKHLADSPVGTMSYDPASVKAEQGHTRMQYRIDFPAERKNAQGKSYRSATMDVAVDCKAATVSLLDLQTNVDPKGQGAVVDRMTLPPSSGEKVAPSSSNEVLFKAACPGVPVPVAQSAPAPQGTPAATPAAPSKPTKK